MVDPESLVNTPPVCFRHGDRETYIRCSRCERSICPDCMTDASVGFQCPVCVAEGRKSQRRPRTIAGASTPGGNQITLGLLGANVVMFVLQQALPALTVNLALVGLASTQEGVIGVADGQLYRLFTATFLHGSIIHLLFNMYALFLVGPTLERQLGRLRFSALYLLSAFGGSVASYAFSSPVQLGVGASGAVFGLFGATLLVGRRLRLETRQILVLLGINLVLGFAIQNIDWRAHLGGLGVGLLFSAALLYAPVKDRDRIQVLAGLVLIAALSAVVVARTAALTG